MFVLNVVHNNNKSCIKNQFDLIIFFSEHVENMHISFQEVKTYIHVYEISNLLEKSYSKKNVKRHKAENVCAHISNLKRKQRYMLSGS